MPSHRIQLKGPWDFDWRACPDEPSEAIAKSGTVTMPQEWRTLFGEASGTAQFRRKFHRPTNLEPHERIMLVLTEVRGSGGVRLNDVPVGHFVGSGGLVEFEISTLMKPVNEVAVDIKYDPVTEPGLSGGLFGAVALEIRS